MLFYGLGKDWPGNNAFSFSRKVFPRFTRFTMPTESNIHPVIQDTFHNLYINEDRNKLIIQDILRDAVKEHVSSLFVLKVGFGVYDGVGVNVVLRTNP